jgi:hypothetical protein
MAPVMPRISWRIRQVIANRCLVFVTGGLHFIGGKIPVEGKLSDNRPMVRHNRQICCLPGQKELSDIHPASRNNQQISDAHTLSPLALSGLAPYGRESFLLT